MVLEYISRPNHCGGVLNPSSDVPERRQLSNGAWIEWKNVPLKRVLNDAESYIQEHVEEKRRSEVWRQVYEGLDRKVPTPKWDTRTGSTNERAATPFSTSRTKPCPSNAELIDALARATNRDLDHLAANIAWEDSYDGNGHWGVLTGFGVKLTVKGGRLGREREHTLEDVPHHFVRDEINALDRCGA